MIGWMSTTRCGAISYESNDTGWLQGFVTVTTFTTWAPYLRFDSHAAASGITADDVRDRQVDVDNVLGAALEAQPRRGDPDNEGVVFPTVAEISLLGGLRGRCCGPVHSLR